MTSCWHGRKPLARVGANVLTGDPFVTVCLAALVVITFAVVVTLRNDLFIPILAVAGILCSRATFIGERYLYIGPALLALAGVAAALTSKRTNRSPIVAFIVVFAAAYFWLGLHESIVPGSEPNLVAILATTLVPVISFVGIARNTKLLAAVTKGLSVTIAVVAVLSVIAFGVGLVVGFGSTFIAQIPLGYSTKNVGLLLPGGFTYGSTLDGGLPRMLGIGREPGLGAVFYVWAFFAMPPVKRRGLLRVFLVLGLLATQSTAGVGLFAAALVAWAVVGRERFRFWPAAAAAVIGGALLWVALYDTTFGFLAKSETLSFNERNAATARGWEALQSNFWDASTTLPLSNVTLIASAAAHGGTWVLIVFALLVFAVLAPGRRNPLAYAAIFIMGTFLTSQPFVDSAAVIVLLMIGVGTREMVKADPHVFSGLSRVKATRIRRSAPTRV